MIIKEIRKDRCFCENIEQIENYEQAIQDPDTTWVMHHRLETHYEDGTLREKEISRDELIKNNKYYYRPPEELIFLTPSEHTRLHNLFLIFTEDTRKKMSEAGKKLKGKKEYMKTQEYREACSKGVKKSFQNGRKPSRGSTGMHWYNDGTKNKMAFECPIGFKEGRLIM